MCFELDERMLAEGEPLTPLDEDEVRALGAKLAGLDVEAVAILLLHSYRNPDHEKRTKAILESCLPGVFVTASYELSQEYREFERCSTVAANAYIGPGVRSYLDEIGEHLEAQSFPGAFLVVQSTGGLYDVAQARHDCVHMLESGPAAGVIAGRALARAVGIENAITFDMGGTTGQVGGDLRRRGPDHGERQDRRLRAGPAGADRDDGHLRGRHRRRVDRPDRRAGRAPRRAGKRRREPGARLLRRRRNSADCDRRQPGARPDRPRPLPRRGDDARFRGRGGGDEVRRRRSARHGPGGGRRRRSPDRGDRHVVRRQGRVDRARARCRRVRAGGLRRRRAAPCERRGARDRHAGDRRPRRRPDISRRSACCTPTCATTTCAPGSPASPTRRWKRSSDSTPRWRRKAARRSPPPARPCPGSSSGVPPTCAMSARSTRSRSTSPPRSSPPATGRRSSGVSTRCTASATAPRRPTSRPSW